MNSTPMIIYSHRRPHESAPRMTFETISVRMNRSDPNIRWGFVVRVHGDHIVIDRVESESLSDKAGVKQGDRVDTINGRSTRGVDANTANRLIDDSYNEVRLSLQRYISSHTCLPWTLSEKDNKMVVEEARSGFGTGFGPGTTQFGSSSFNKSSSNFGSSPAGRLGDDAATTTSSLSRHNQSQSSRQVNVPVAVVDKHSSSSGYKSNSSFSTNTANFGRQSRAPFGANYTNNVSSTNNYNNSPAAFNKSTTFSGTNNNTGSGYQRSVSPGKAYGYGAGAGGGAAGGRTSVPLPAPAPASASHIYSNGTPSANYGRGGVPLNQQTFVQTTNLPVSTPAGLSPGGKVFYHSPGSRTRRDLSPGSAIQHLQYNSPMNLYSSETAAEQYFQQTGVQPEHPPPHDRAPAYLNSETRKLIEEEARGRSQRGRSPSTQSSCFKRISHAVGADN